MAKIINDPSKAGQNARPKSYFGFGNRYSITPVHTRFGICWFVCDEEQLDELGLPTVLAQEDTRDEAFMAGLRTVARRAKRAGQ